MKITREKLYEEIWSDPMTTVAKRYGVSSNYLARICERLNVPRPGRGHWQQKAAGMDVPTERLPAVEPGADIEWSRDGTPPARAPLSAGSPRRWGPGGRPKRHPILDGARPHFDQIRQGYPKTYVLPRKRNLVDVFVTPATLDRALKLANDLFLFLEDRGLRVMLAPSNRSFRRADLEVREGAGPKQLDFALSRGHWTPWAPTVVLVGGVAIGLTLYETEEEVETTYDNRGNVVRYVATTPRGGTRHRRLAEEQRRWVSKRWMASGRLGLHAYAANSVAWEHSWIEKTVGDLPARFEEVASTLEGAIAPIQKLLEEARVEAERREREYKEQERRWRREEAEQRRKEAEQRRKEAELEREKALIRDVAAWRLAHDIRAFVAEAERRLVPSDGMSAGELVPSLKWALECADRMDPMVRIRTERGARGTDT